MPSSVTRSPKAATCEDVDEDTQAVKPGSRTSANVSKKRSQSSDLNRKSAADQKSQHGSDSGYSSKAGTNDSMASGRKNPTSLTVNTDVMDRPSQPYSYTPAKNKPAVRPTPKVEITRERPAKKEERFRHPDRVCPTCDQFGYHVEFAENPVKPTQPKSPKVAQPVKNNSGTSATTARPQARRPSSNTRERPRSLFLSPTQQLYPMPVFVEHPSPIMYGPPPPPTPPPAYHQPFQYTYATGPPILAQPCDCQVFGNVDHNHQAMTPYVESPVITYPPYPEQHLLYPSHRRPSNDVEFPVAYISRPRSDTSRPSKVYADKLAMPPPPKPAPRRSSVEPNTRRPSVHYEDDERHIITSKRVSRDMSYYGPPPSAWKNSAHPDTTERPKARKSASYSDASTANTASAQREVLSRRVTDPLDEKTAQAEAYQTKVSKGSSDSLTSEALRRLDKPRTSSSETGTVRSKDSRRGRRSSTVVSNSGNTNITVDGGIQISIPQDMTDQELQFQIGKLKFSMNRDTEQKQLERAPSNASRDSRRTLSGASAIDEKDSTRSASRKSSHPEKIKNSSAPSKRSSRAPSVSSPEKERP